MASLTPHVRAVIERAIRHAERCAEDCERKAEHRPEPYCDHYRERAEAHRMHVTELREALVLLEREQRGARSAEEENAVSTAMLLPTE